MPGIGSLCQAAALHVLIACKLESARRRVQTMQFRVLSRMGSLLGLLLPKFSASHARAREAARHSLVKIFRLTFALQVVLYSAAGRVGSLARPGNGCKQCSFAS